MKGHVGHPDFGTATKNFRTRCPHSLASGHSGMYPESQSSLVLNPYRRILLAWVLGLLLYLAMLYWAGHLT